MGTETAIFPDGTSTAAPVSLKLSWVSGVPEAAATVIFLPMASSRFVMAPSGTRSETQSRLATSPAEMTCPSSNWDVATTRLTTSPP